MNLEGGRKSSMDELLEKNRRPDPVAQAKEQLEAAATVVPCVAVTEENWSRMIALQRSQLQMLELLLRATGSLTTRKQLENLLEEQRKWLTAYTENMARLTQEYQAALRQEAENTTLNMKKMTEELSSQAGKMSERFGSDLSEERAAMKKYTRSLFWISLIPSLLLLLIHWLLPLMMSLVS